MDLFASLFTTINNANSQKISELSNNFLTLYPENKKENLQDFQSTINTGQNENSPFLQLNSQSQPFKSDSKHDQQTTHNQQQQKFRKIIEQTPQINHAYKTMPVRKQINNKYRTFMNWSYKDEIRNQSKKRKGLTKFREQTNGNDMLAAIMKMALSTAQQQKQKDKKLAVQELPGVKQQRRERFKRYNNPLFIIKHYMQKQDYKPHEEVMILFEKLIKVRSSYQKHANSSDLERILQNVYAVMNAAVDYNELRFLTLLIMLAGDICFESKDFNRSYYFYNQARIASTYAQLFRIKTDSILGMAKISMELKKYVQAITLFKKCLQYAWKTKNSDVELRVYDYIGTCYYYQGNVKIASYYHNRYSQCEFQRQNSAIKRISMQMLQEYFKRIYALQKQNLNSLFIQYLNLPIKGFDVYPPAKVLNPRLYINYENGESPRKNRGAKQFAYINFPNVAEQITVLFYKDIQFDFEIPDPDVQRNFVPQFNKYGRLKKNLQFTQTSEFHKLIGVKPPALDFQAKGIYKFPLQKRIQRRLADKPDNLWWQKMVANNRKQRSQKVGKLRDHTINSHQSYAKYPDQKRRSHSLKVQKIKQSFNRTLLDFIDPMA